MLSTRSDPHPRSTVISSWKLRASSRARTTSVVAPAHWATARALRETGVGPPCPGDERSRSLTVAPRRSRWCCRKDEYAQKRRHRRYGEGCRVDVYGVHPRDARWRGSFQCRDAGPRQQEPGRRRHSLRSPHASQSRQSQQPPRPGAERDTHRRLVAPRDRARGQQAADVETGDDQHHADAGEQHPGRASEVADDRCVQRLDRDRPSAIALRELPREGVRDRASSARAWSIGAPGRSRATIPSYRQSRSLWPIGSSTSRVGTPQIHRRAEREPVRHDPDDAIDVRRRRRLRTPWSGRLRRAGRRAAVARPRTK